ncbi:uncharacterized protein PV09_04269 [Verruconis gallopava]|uniref:EthD domain-containing protein n=1 Tax=Verruconis gallopava TaxID=253628 RepID=A0A0D2AZK6_9PEZI|nr:uncharacterized protein PV09_04269 [Verruconis gallopava]KIW04514.1 hypothetical protein PV09_04269 [Verruconis gallopava]
MSEIVFRSRFDNGRRKAFERSPKVSLTSPDFYFSHCFGVCRKKTSMGPPGIIWVASRVTQPDKLSEERFCEWYEGQHIDEVTALSGVPAAARYEAVPMSELAGPPTAETIKAAEQRPDYLMGGKWLTIYEMKDVDFRHTAEFKSLDGQSKPKGNLLDEIFTKAHFETRFGALLSNDDKGIKKGPGKLIISATMTPGSRASAEDIEQFYEREHVAEIAKCPGYVRTRRFRWVDTTVLKEFERLPADPIEPGNSVVALHEFEGPYFPMEGLLKADETPWTARVLESLKKNGIEAGFYRLKRVYGEWLPGSSKL